MLITGFEGYGGRSDNPSQDIARALDGTTVGSTVIKGRVLSVTNHNLRKNITDLIDEHKPSFVVCLGLAPGEKMIRIERMAANFSRFEISDNAGDVIHGPVVADAPAAYDSTLPVDELLSAVLGCGIPAHVSHTAGTFLCNAVMYHALDYCSVHYPDTRCGFIHLPYLPTQVSELITKTANSELIELHQRSDLASMEFRLQLQAINSIVNCLVRQV